MAAIFKRREKLLAMDFGAASIKCCVGHYRDAVLQIDQLFTINIENGLYDNGVIRDDGRLHQLLKSQLDLHRVRAKSAIVIAESTEILKRDIVVPQVDDADMADLVQFEVTQYLPIETDDYIIQHQGLERFVEDEQPKQWVRVAAMPKDMAKSHFDLLTEIGLKPTRMDLSGTSMLRMAQLCLSNQERVTAFIDVGDYKIEINILEGDNVKLNRILNIGLHTLQEIMLGYQLKPPVVDELKVLLAERGLDNLEAALLDRGIDQANLLAQDIDDYFSHVVSEVEKVFKFYVSRQVNNRIDRVYIYGGVAKIASINTFFENHYHIETMLFNHCASSVLNVEQTDDLTQYVVAIGGLIKA